jgi:plastocyanin
VALRAPPALEAAPPGAAVDSAAVLDGAVVVEVSLGEYVIELSRQTLPLGPVRFDVTNAGNARHNLHVTGDGVDVRSANLLSGQSGTVLATFGRAGEYTVFCDLGFHASAGMTVTLLVG